MQGLDERVKQRPLIQVGGCTGALRWRANSQADRIDVWSGKEGMRSTSGWVRSYCRAWGLLGFCWYIPFASSGFLMFSASYTVRILFGVWNRGNIHGL